MAKKFITNIVQKKAIFLSISAVVVSMSLILMPGTSMVHSEAEWSRGGVSYW